MKIINPEHVTGDKWQGDVAGTDPACSTARFKLSCSQSSLRLPKHGYQSCFTTAPSRTSLSDPSRGMVNAGVWGGESLQCCLFWVSLRSEHLGPKCRIFTGVTNNKCMKQKQPCSGNSTPALLAGQSGIRGARCGWVLSKGALGSAPALPRCPGLTALVLAGGQVDGRDAGIEREQTRAAQCVTRARLRVGGQEGAVSPECHPNVTQMSPKCHPCPTERMGRVQGPPRPWGAVR